MGWWFVLFLLDAGVPVQVQLYTHDEQRCLTVAQEHLEAVQGRPGTYIEVVFVNCVEGSPPRS